jgi:hypothetical protein
VAESLTSTGGAESNSPARVWSPRRSPEHAGKWLPSPVPPRATLFNKQVRPLCSSEGNELERLFGFEPKSSAWKTEALPLDDRRQWCRDQGSHPDVAAFNGAQGLPLLSRRSGCGIGSRIRQGLLMRQAGTRCFPHELERPPGYAPGLRDWQTRVLLLDDGRENGGPQHGGLSGNRTLRGRLAKLACAPAPNPGADRGDARPHLR